MLSNKEIANYFKLAAQLAELHNENSFKVQSLQSTGFKISRYPVQLNTLPETERETVEGLSKNAIKKIGALLDRGSFDELDEYLAKTPPGIIELLQVKGVGPKKVATLWEMGIENTGELLYACNENRLIELPGFGKKTQEQIRHAIEYKRSSEGKHLYAALEPIAFQLLTDLKQEENILRVSLTGAIRRKLEILTGIDLFVSVKNVADLVSFFESHPLVDDHTVTLKTVDSIEKLEATIGSSIRLSVQLSSEDDFTTMLFSTTASEAHLNWLGEKKLSIPPHAESEKEIYSAIHLPYFEPELREGEIENLLLAKKNIPDLIRYEDLKGTLHNHTTYSDGADTLTVMAEYCTQLGLDYLGICDHSKSAFYANGLKEDRIIQQQEEIDTLNNSGKYLRIFKGIESDILSDGSLDYPDDILKTFDFIVASVHSNLRMEEDKAMQRLLKAIENPYTTILGHMTSRLLLARPGYPVDHKKIIDACAANNVVIELNANPYRLDMDWRHIQYALEKGVMISINPDAHRKEGIHDMHFGICAARKGGLTKEMTFNALSAIEIEELFNSKK